MSTTAQSHPPAGGHGTADEVAQAQQQMNWAWILGIGRDP